MQYYWTFSVADLTILMEWPSTGASSASKDKFCCLLPLFQKLSISPWHAWVCLWVVIFKGCLIRFILNYNNWTWIQTMNCVNQGVLKQKTNYAKVNENYIWNWNETWIMNEVVGQKRVIWIHGFKKDHLLRN